MSEFPAIEVLLPGRSKAFPLKRQTDGEFVVREDGVLLVFDYGVREQGGAHSGLIAAFMPGQWTAVSILAGGPGE